MGQAEGIATIVIGLIILLAIILITRLVGAWMLRIDEVIKHLRYHGDQNKEIIAELKKMNKEEKAE